MGIEKTEMAIAHLRRTPDGGVAEPHDLRSHLDAVAEVAGQFADEFGNGDWEELWKPLA